MVDKTTTKNYLKSRELSQELADNIVNHYRDNPAYPKDFWKKIQVVIVKNTHTGDFYVRSNLTKLFANVADLEDRYS